MLNHFPFVKFLTLNALEPQLMPLDFKRLDSTNMFKLRFLFSAAGKWLEHRITTSKTLQIYSQ